MCDQCSGGDEMEYEIQADGDRVWINTADGMVGRFSKRGIDVHGEGHCAPGGCEPGPCGVPHWERFKAKMWEHHGIVVPETAKPRWL
jgi:hypothetical protein